MKLFITSFIRIGKQYRYRAEMLIMHPLMRIHRFLTTHAQHIYIYILYLRTYNAGQLLHIGEFLLYQFSSIP